MTTSLAIATTVSHIAQKLGQFFQMLPASGGGLGDHYTDNPRDLIERVLLKGRRGQRQGADLVMDAGKWWSYYFARQNVVPDVDRPKDLAGRIAIGTPQERYVRVRVLPYSKVTIDYNVVSNDMEMLEDLEEAFLLRTTTLTQEFGVEIEGTDFFFSMQYAFLDGSLNYRIEPTALGSLSVLSLPVEIRYPILRFTETVKEIRTIKFRIFLMDSREVIKVVEIPPSASNP